MLCCSSTGKTGAMRYVLLALQKVGEPLDSEVLLSSVPLRQSQRNSCSCSHGRTWAGHQVLFPFFPPGGGEGSGPSPLLLSSGPYAAGGC